jgi:hypothetical protein
VAFAIRAITNTFTGAVTVNLLKNGIVFASAALPAAGTTTVTPFTSTPFVAGDDIEVQVSVPISVGGSSAVTVVVEFT